VGELKHGKASTYRKHACRCEDCRIAAGSSGAQARAKVATERVLVGGRLVHPRGTHGVEGGYIYYSCRCLDCTAAHTQAAADRRAAGRG
jgi:hypothetical protein